MIQLFDEKCRVCNAKAFGFNYYVVTCNACKMFFRRVVIEKLKYCCCLSGKCFDKIENRTVKPRCKACRFEKCIKVGMKYVANGRTETDRLPLVITNPEDSLVSLIGPLLYLDSQREYHFQNIYTDADPSMVEILSRPNKGFSGPIVGLEKDVPLDQWSFFRALTSVEFLGNLDFMSDIELTDRVILVKSFAMKSSLLSSCFQCKEKKYDRLVNPDGVDICTDAVLQIPTFTAGFLNRIRKHLITHMIEMKITQEEYILANVILFCNHALPGFTPRGQYIINMQQKRYCAVLLKHCLWKYQKNGPARLCQLISLGTVLSTAFQDAQSLVTICQMCMLTAKNNKVTLECFTDNVL